MQLSSSRFNNNKEEAAKEKAEKEKQNPVSAAELATEQEAKRIISGESKQVEPKFQGQVPLQPTYDELQEAETKIEG